MDLIHAGLKSRFRFTLSFFISLFVVQATLTPDRTFAVEVSRDYQEVKVFMSGLAAAHPATTRLFDLGVADSGEVIQGMAISGGGSINNLVVATHHGNEYGSTEVAKSVALSLAQSPLKGQTVYIIPVLNIVGYNARLRQETNGNMSFDPNRDYPGPCGTEGPFKLKSTAALAKFIDEKAIVSSATLHTHFPAVAYPWGFGTKDLSTPHDDLFKQLGAAATVESHYAVGNSTEVIYPASGTFEDYAFWKHGVWSLLFELGYTHNPTDKEVEELLRVNVPGIRRMLEQAPTLRAEKHSFTGKCDFNALLRDLHNE